MKSPITNDAWAPIKMPMGLSRLWSPTDKRVAERDRFIQDLVSNEAPAIREIRIEAFVRKHMTTHGQSSLPR